MRKRYDSTYSARAELKMVGGKGLEPLTLAL